MLKIYNSQLEVISPTLLQDLQSFDQSDVGFVLVCYLEVEVDVGSLETKPGEGTPVQFDRATR